VFKVTAKKLVFSLIVLGITVGACFVVWHRSRHRIVTVSSMAQVREIVFSDVLNHASTPSDVLVFFDIDNTLIAPATEIASDQWFDACLRWCHAKGFTPEQAVKYVRPVWITLLKKATMRPVEPQVVMLVGDLISRHVPVIAVTSRTMQLHELTTQQLHDVGIDFSASMLAKKTLMLNDKSSVICFEKGVLFCSGTDKGAAVVQLLDQLQLNPTIIVCVDDKEHHIRSVAKVAAQCGCSFVGLRYGFLDDKVKRFKLDNESIALLDYALSISQKNYEY
jgi:hypothetical protein